MALLFRGLTECPLCGRVIAEDDEATLFPAFALSKGDPFVEFSDGSFHETCLMKSRRGLLAIARVEHRMARTGPGKRKCVVCTLEVLDPDDYLLIDFLGEAGADSLAEFSFTHLHKSCVRNWSRRGEFVALAREALASDHWNAVHLRALVAEIEAYSGAEEQ